MNKCATFDFVLDDPIDFVKPGADSKTYIKTLILKAPSNLHRRIINKMDGMLASANMNHTQNQIKMLNMSGEELMRLVESRKTTQTIEQTESDISQYEALQIIKFLKESCSQNYDFYNDFCEEFKNLLLSHDICRCQEIDKPLSANEYDKMSIKDGERLLGEYLKNFFTLSLSL